MALRFKFQLMVVADDDQQASVDEVVVFDKEYDQPEELGLTLHEPRRSCWQSSARSSTARSLRSWLRGRSARPAVGHEASKIGRPSSFRTLFGKLELASPRLRRCPCQCGGQASTSPLRELLPEHTAPELLYLESKWASLVPYGLTVEALQDFLPVGTTLNASTVRRDTLRVAGRLEAELGPEPIFPLAGCPDACASLPAAPPPITVGLDGGYLRSWDNEKTHFVAIVGEAVSSDGPAKRLGFVQGHDPKARRHLAAVLEGQGLRHNQELVFLSDGEESLRQLQCYLRPHSQHLVDWFHLSMRMTGLGQFLKGLAHLDAERAAELQDALQHTRWNLWHGKVQRASHWLRQIEWRMWHFAGS